MKTFRIETERSRECDGCRWWNGYCKFIPSIKKYKADDSACLYDDAVTFNDKEEQEIIESIRKNDGETVDFIEAVIDSMVSFNDFCGDEQERRWKIFEYVMAYYEKIVKEEK